MLIYYKILNKASKFIHTRSTWIKFSENIIADFSNPYKRKHLTKPSIFAINCSSRSQITVATYLELYVNTKPGSSNFLWLISDHLQSVYQVKSWHFSHHCYSSWFNFNVSPKIFWQKDRKISLFSQKTSIYLFDSVLNTPLNVSSKWSSFKR